MNFTVKTLTDEEVAVEMNRKRGVQSEWPETLVAILASEGCSIDKPWCQGFEFPGIKSATAAAGLRKAAKNAKHDSLVIRENKDKTEVRIINSVKA